MGGNQELSIFSLHITVSLPDRVGGPSFSAPRVWVTWCLLPPPEKQVYQQCPPGPAGVLCCHILILTLGKSAALPGPAQCPGHQTWPYSGLRANKEDRPAVALSAYIPHFSPGRARPSQPSAGQRDEGAAALVHSRAPQASWWPPTTKPERARDFLETSWNCSEQREKQADSRGVHSVRGRGSKTPLIVYKLHRVTTNRMPSREGERL